jgi:hypothetical protein
VGGKGRTHDFELLKQATLRIAQAIEKEGEAGDQGRAKRFANGLTPIKKPKARALTADEKAYNRALARLRIVIEPVNRRWKILRIVKEIYRGKHRHDPKTWTVVAALVNGRYAEELCQP